MVELPIRRQIPDELPVVLERGGGVLVFSDLRLGGADTDVAREVERVVARAIDECKGPAVVVFAGDAFDLRAGIDVRAAFAASPRLASSLGGFVASDDHRWIVLPGVRDAALAFDPAACEAITALGGEVALACALEIDTGTGPRLVHVEPGHRFDPGASFNDPFDPNDRPLALHLARAVTPAIAAGNAGWLDGVDDLVDRDQAGAFVASRLAYRRLLRRAGWLLVPTLLALAVFWSFLEVTGLRSGGGATGRVLRLLGGGLALELAIVAVAVVFMVTQLRDALGGVAWWGAQPRGNDDARGEAIVLARVGGVGLVTAHTRRPELTDLGSGSFYANCGSGGRVVERVDARAGLPPVFVEELRCSWFELEAGAELHARLWHGARDLPKTTWLEKLAARRRPRASWPPVVVAEHPGTVTWPSAGDATALRRRTRRIAATVIALAGVLNLASAVTVPLASRLDSLERFAPIEVPEVAAVLVALAGVGLLFVARGVRRGQRRAWTVALCLLLLSAAGHVIKGLDVEEATLTLFAAGFLATHASDFAAPAHPSSTRRVVVAAFAGVAVAITAGMVGVEIRSPRPPLDDAFRDVSFRLVGYRDGSVAPRARHVDVAGAARGRHRNRGLRPLARVPSRRRRACVVVQADVTRPRPLSRRAVRHRLAVVLRPARRQGMVRLPRHARRVPSPERRSRSCRPTRSGRPRSAPTRGPRSASSPTSTAGRSRSWAPARTGFRCTPPAGCTTSTSATRPSSTCPTSISTASDEEPAPVGRAA